MHLYVIDALAAGQDGRWAAAERSSVGPPGSNVEWQLTGAVAYSQSRPGADGDERPLQDPMCATLIHSGGGLWPSR